MASIFIKKDRFFSFIMFQPLVTIYRFKRAVNKLLDQIGLLPCNYDIKLIKCILNA